MPAFSYLTPYPGLVVGIGLPRPKQALGACSLTFGYIFFLFTSAKEEHGQSFPWNELE